MKITHETQNCYQPSSIEELVSDMNRRNPKAAESYRKIHSVLETFQDLPFLDRAKYSLTYDEDNRHFVIILYTRNLTGKESRELYDCWCDETYNSIQKEINEPIYILMDENDWPEGWIKMRLTQKQETMTDYQILQEAMTSQGWTKKRQTKGDHIMFSHEQSGKSVVISMGVSGRNTKNIISDIRSIQPDFTCRLCPIPRKQKTERNILTTFPTESIPSCRNKKNSLAKNYSWIKLGTEVRYSAAADWDFSQLNNPKSILNKVFTVDEFLPNGKLMIACEDNRVEVCANEIDSLETMVCPKCGNTVPVTYAYPGKGMCKRCYNEKVTRHQQEEAEQLPNKVFDSLYELHLTTGNKYLKDILEAMDYSIDIKGNKITTTILIGDVPQDELESLYREIGRYLQEKFPKNESMVVAKKKEKTVQTPEPSCSETEAQQEIQNNQQQQNQEQMQQTDDEKIEQVTTKSTETVEIEQLLAQIKEKIDILKTKGVTVTISDVEYTVEEEIIITKKRTQKFNF